MNRRLGLLSTGLLLGLGFLASSAERDFESRAASEISGRLEGDKKSVSVNIRPSGLEAIGGRLDLAEIKASDFSIRGLPLFTEPERSQAGRVDLLSLRLRDFSLRGLRIAELNADIPDCRYDFGLATGKGQIRLSRSGVGRGSVSILEKDLSDYIVRKYSEIKRCTVKVYNGVVWVEGYGEFLVVNSNFAVIAKIGVTDGTQLNLTNAKVYFDWKRGEPGVAGALLKSLNPVVDLREDLGLYDAVTVETVTLEGGVLRAEGATKIPVKPADN